MLDVGAGAARRELPPRPRPAVRAILVGAALVVVPLALIVPLLGLAPDGGAAPSGAAPAVAADPFARLLVALPVVLAACYLAGRLARRTGQPEVIGEILAGVLLGPSLLGLVWPAGFAWLFPAPVVTAVNTLAQLGLVFFMYLVGAEMNLESVRRRGLVAATVSQVNLALPALCGIVLALGMYPTFGEGVGFLPFGLFLAVSLSVTAFPVLARILADRGITDTPLGALALTCAAIGDVVAWCVLTFVTAVARDRSTASVLVTIALTLAFVAVMVFAVRPLLARWLPGRPPAAVLPLILGGVMLSALATNEIGIHPIFGAFLFGAIAPRKVPAVTEAAHRMQSVTVTLLLPLFFVYTGLHTRFGLLGTDGRRWAWCALIVVVAMVSKWGGTSLAARLTGTGWRESLSLGALMNCRGLTELVVLNIGLQLGVISPTVFSMLVVMTLVSTMATGPALSLIARLRRRPGSTVDEKRPAAPGTAAAG
ncbi:cation:proton antiporter domain-containing protein [Dactylosporangium sp. CA-139066]|uniref:cation:proton antiporter domain-containing protein n=1 Tax=Dactylosporangium sp. CA-139066 TaxID=3239930 RepID=UPI003D8DBD5B